MNKETQQQSVGKVGSYFSEISQVFVDDYVKKGLKEHTKSILQFFDNQDISGSAILELGCGVGGLLFKLLERGAKHAYGIDLSSKMIENAKIFSKSLQLENQTNFFVGDFIADAKRLIPVNQVDIIIADRVLCCSPVPKEILNLMIQYNPKYIVIVQPRKNRVARILLDLKIKLRRIKMGLKSHGIKIPFVSIKEYDKYCKNFGYQRIFQNFRYAWEVVIYQKSLI